MPLVTSNLLPKSTAPNPLTPLSKVNPVAPTGPNVFSGLAGSLGKLGNAISNYKPPAPPQSPLTSLGYTGGASGNQTTPVPTPAPQTQSNPITGKNTAGSSTPATSNASTQPATYQGVPINSGTDAEVQAQIQAINAKNNPTPAPSPTPTATQNPPFETNAGMAPATASFPGLVNRLSESVGNNQALGSNAQEIARKAAEDYGNVTRQGILASGGNLSSGLAPVGQGLASQIQANTGALQQGISQQENAALAGNAQALTAQGQTQSGLSTAIGATQPVAGATFFGNQLTGGLVGGAGNAGNTGVTGNSLIDGSVSKALQAIQSGASFNDAVSLLVGGDVAKQALLTKMGQANGGTIPNITGQNAGANQQANLGTQTQAQAYNLNQALQSLKAVQPKAIDFLSNSPLNQTSSPFYNQKINDYVSTLGNSPAASQWASIKNEITTYANQILSAKQSSNLPTTQDEQLAAQDPGLLNPQGLQSVLNTWDTLGQTNLGVLQKIQAGALGGNGGYTGPSAIKTGNIPVASPNTSLGSGLTGTVAPFLAGTAMGLAGTVGQGVAHAIANPSNFLGWVTAALEAIY